MVRKGDGEKVTKELISQSKLNTVLKRFLGSKATDEEVTKWYKCENGLHYMATNLGSSVDLLFTNNFAGTYNPLGETYYSKPSKDAEKVDGIDQYVEVKDGKKKKLMKTGHKLEYPDVKGLFDKYNLDDFGKITLTKDEFNEIISLHETMESMLKAYSNNSASVIKVNDGKISFTVYNTPYKFLFEKKVETNASVKYYFYNPTFMVNIFKSLKDLDVDTVDLYINNVDPILFVSKSNEYTFKFAMHRLIVRK